MCDKSFSQPGNWKTWNDPHRSKVHLVCQELLSSAHFDEPQVKRATLSAPYSFVGHFMSSNYHVVRSSYHTLGTSMVSFLYGPSHGSSSDQVLRNSSHTLCTWMVSIQCQYSWVFSSDEGMINPSHTLGTETALYTFLSNKGQYWSLIK